jgi:hypothetical protein
MCPACFVAISWVVAGVVSSGGVTVLAVKALHGRGAAKEVKGNQAEKKTEESPGQKEKESEQ